MDKLANIIAFSTVAETLSFAAAARRLNLANSVVSKRIKDLEDDLGVALLQRSTRRVALTDAGYRYVEQARRLIDELAELEDNLRASRENPVGEIKVSAPMTFANLFLGPALSGFLDKYPDVSVRLMISEHHLELAREDSDIGIVIGQPQHPALVTRKIAQTRRVAVASPAYLARHGRPATPQDLVTHNCLRYSNESDGKSWAFQSAGRALQQPVTGRFVSDSGTLLCEAARAGCGIAWLPTFIAGQDVQDGRLEIVLEDYELPPLPIYLVWHYQRHMSARMRKFIDHMVEFFGHFDDGAAAG